MIQTSMASDSLTLLPDAGALLKRMSEKDSGIHEVTIFRNDPMALPDFPDFMFLGPMRQYPGCAGFDISGNSGEEGLNDQYSG